MFVMKLCLEDNINGFDIDLLKVELDNEALRN